MFLSIVIPCYNAEKYIGECLDSCVNQNFDASDYEIICVNDGSTDSSKQIIQERQKQSNLIKLIDQENSGVSSARNTGIEAASGDYIWFVDADDFIQNGAIEKLYILYMQQHAQNNSSPIIIDAISFLHYEFENCLTDTERQLKDRFSIYSNNTPAGYGIYDSIFRRECILTNHLRFHPEISYGEDGLFVYEFSSCSSFRSVIDEVLYFYRRNNTSLTRTRTLSANQKRQSSAFQTAKIMAQYAIDKKRKEASNSHDMQAATIMPMVRSVTISAAKLDRPNRKDILNLLKSENLFPLFMYRHIKDWFPKAIHMNHSYMGLKGKVLDILNFYSTTTIGFYALVLANKLLKKYRY